MEGKRDSVIFFFFFVFLASQGPKKKVHIWEKTQIEVKLCIQMKHIAL